MLHQYGSLLIFDLTYHCSCCIDESCRAPKPVFRRVNSSSIMALTALYLGFLERRYEFTMFSLRMRSE